MNYHDLALMEDNEGLSDLIMDASQFVQDKEGHAPVTCMEKSAGQG